jgi:hypothetical protein
MTSLEPEIAAHLFMIEEQYGVTIPNKEAIISRIAAFTQDSRLVLSVAFSLNHWMAMHRSRGTVEIPMPVLEMILSTVR